MQAHEGLIGRRVAELQGEVLLAIPQAVEAVDFRPRFPAIGEHQGKLGHRANARRGIVRGFRGSANGLIARGGKRRLGVLLRCGDGEQVVHELIPSVLDIVVDRA